MSDDIRSRLIDFLGPAFSAKDRNLAMKVELLYCPGKGLRDEQMREWERSDRPEIFEQLDLIEALIMQIIKLAEDHADNAGAGSHKFKVRVHQQFNGKPFLLFAIKPSHDSYAGDESTAMMAPGGGMGGSAQNDAVIGALNMVSGHAGQLMRINTQMHGESFRVLANLTEDLRDENIKLRTENSQLRKELEAAQSNKEDREYQFAMAHSKNQRTDAAVSKAIQIGTVIAAKITGMGKELGAPDGLGMLLTEFGKSLRPEQIQALMGVLDQGQIIMFMQIMEMVQPKPPPQQQQRPQAQMPPPGAAPGQTP